MKKIRSMVLVSGDPVSMERGAEEVYRRLVREIEEFGLQDEISVMMVGDLGRHDALPLVIVYPEAVIYGPVKPTDVHHLVEEHLYKGRIVADLQAAKRELTGPIAWLNARKGTLPAEQRIVLERAGLIDPESIEDYIAHDGYQALGKALTEMTPADRDRRDRAIGFAGARRRGFPGGPEVEVRQQGPRREEVRDLQCRRKRTRHVQRSIGAGRRSAQHRRGAGDCGLRGGRGRRLHLRARRISTGADAVAARHRAGPRDEPAGPEYLRHGFQLRSARSLRRGRVHLRRRDRADRIDRRQARRTARAAAVSHDVSACGASPRSSTTSRRWRTCTAIIRRGADWYRKFGTPKSPGTKVYTILGNVNVTGVIEVPMGITLREVIAIYGKGMKNGAQFKLAQTGGSSGSIIPATLQDTPMDFESCQKAGVSLGSGALLICDERHLRDRSGESADEFLQERKLRQVYAVPHRHLSGLSPARSDFAGPGRARPISIGCCCWPIR